MSIAVCLGLLLVFAAPAAAEPLLYRIADDDNTVWLLGSIHVLRAADYPLDARIESAYARAERVVFELSPSERDPVSSHAVLRDMGLFHDGRQLRDIYDDHAYAQLGHAMQPLGLNVARFAGAEPWFVALQVTRLNQARYGLSPALGVDAHFTARAMADGKHVVGLETLREQLARLDRLPLARQKTFLQETITGSATFLADMNHIIGLWRRGDPAALAALLDDDALADPGLRESLIADRNRRWVPHIERYLAGATDTLVIVGALHLVGEWGVVALLRAEGYDVTVVTG